RIDLVSGDLLRADRTAREAEFASIAWRKQAPTDREARYWGAIVDTLQGTTEGQLGDPHAAVADIDAALVEIVRLAEEFPDDVRFDHELSVTRWLLGGYLGGVGEDWSWTAGIDDYARSERESRGAEELAERGVRKDPNDVRAIQTYGAMLEVVAAAIARHDPS